VTWATAVIFTWILTYRFLLDSVAFVGYFFPAITDFLGDSLFFLGAALSTYNFGGEQIIITVCYRNIG
jgi:hypothetical protein